MSRFEIFTRLPLFEGVSLDELFSLLAKISLDFESFKEGDSICIKGEPCKGLLLLMDGTVSIDGQSVEAPALLDYTHVFGNVRTFGKNILAKSACSTLCIDTTSLSELLLSSPDVLNNYLTLLSNTINR